MGNESEDEGVYDENDFEDESDYEKSGEDVSDYEVDDENVCEEM